MDAPPLQPGDHVEILSQGVPPTKRHQVRGRPQPALRYGRVVSINAERGYATVYLRERHYPVDVPVDQLRRVEP
jgi:hypothetical protein